MPLVAVPFAKLPLSLRPGVVVLLGLLLVGFLLLLLVFFVLALLIVRRFVSGVFTVAVTISVLSHAQLMFMHACS